MFKSGIFLLFLSIAVSGFAPACFATEDARDEDGRLVKSLDENGQEIYILYDAEGRPVGQQDGGGDATRLEIDEPASTE